MKSFILYLAFIEGLLVMTTELLGGAIITPFYGTGLTVWTFVLGITMFSLGTGYLFGGYIIKKADVQKLISILVPVIVFFMFLMPLIANGSFQANTEESFEWSILKGILPVFFLPLFCAGILSTVLVQSFIETGSEPGVASGKIYGISTISGIVTALCIGFYLLNQIELNLLLFIFAIVGISGSIIFPYTKNKSLRIALSIACLVFISLIYAEIATNEVEEISNNTQTLYKSNGILGEVKVTRDITNNTTMFYVNNSLQSTLGSNGYSSLPYVKYICYFLSHRNRNNKVMLAGMGGGNIVRDLQSLGFSIDVVELDKRVIKCAIEYFGVSLKGSQVVVDDARHYINTTKKKYDIVVLDLSIGETIPSNVYTIESFTEVHELLAADGLMALHLFSSENGTSVNAIRSLGKTMQQAGFHVYLFNTEVHPKLPSPYIFIASKNKINFDSLNYSLYHLKGNRIFSSPNGDIRKFDFSSGMILTDDSPMLEIFQRDIVSFFRKSYISDFQKFQ